jgi:hypothetical protein
VTPPGVKGTIKRTGLLGKSLWANALSMKLADSIVTVSASKAKRFLGERSIVFGKRGIIVLLSGLKKR